MQKTEKVKAKEGAVVSRHYIDDRIKNRGEVAVCLMQEQIYCCSQRVH